MNTFKVGDVVILKSSKLCIIHPSDVPTPLMTVTEYPHIETGTHNTVNNNKCRCTWYIGGEFRTLLFPVDALEIYTKN